MKLRILLLLLQSAKTFTILSIASLGQYSYLIKVDLETHIGYRGQLTYTICKTAPYYADRNVEVIFNCPYLSTTFSSIFEDSSVLEPTHSKPETVSSRKNMDISINTRIHDTNDDSLVNETLDDPIVTPISLAQSPEAVRSIFSNIMSDNLVFILWVEDLEEVSNIPKKISAYSNIKPLANPSFFHSLFIIVHPIKFDSLYLIKLFGSTGNPLTLAESRVLF